MEDHLYTFDVKESETVIIILDASESAENTWQEIVDLTKKILLKLPGEVQKKLFFLGNSEEYDIEKFEENVSKWRKENRNRGSFITPIFNAIQNANPGKIVLIGTGIVYDLDDWAEAKVIENFFLVKIRESMKGSSVTGTEIDSRVFNGSMIDPVQSIQIRGKDGFMPYFWDNPEYKISLDKEIVLKSENNQRSYSVNIASFGTKIFANLKKKDKTEKILLIQVDSPPQDSIQIIENYDDDWQNFTKDEGIHFRQYKDAEDVPCRSCNQPLQSLHCIEENCRKKSAIFGQIIYQSLDNSQIRGFVIFKDSSEGVQFKKYPSEIIKIGDSKVAIKNGSEAIIKKYDSRVKEWVNHGKLKLFHPLGKGYYVSII